MQKWIINPYHGSRSLNFVNVNYDVFVPLLFVVVSILLISKIPTYALKKITVPRKMTIFLLLAVVLYFGTILIYTFNAIFLSGLIYFILIPVSYFHYRKLSKKFIDLSEDPDDHEDIL